MILVDPKVPRAHWEHKVGLGVGELGAKQSIEGGGCAQPKLDNHSMPGLKV